MYLESARLAPTSSSAEVLSLQSSKKEERGLWRSVRRRVCGIMLAESFVPLVLPKMLLYYRVGSFLEVVFRPGGGCSLVVSRLLRAELFTGARDVAYSPQRTRINGLEHY